MEFKVQVVLEAFKEQLTINELSSHYRIHSNQVNQWKKQAVESLPQVQPKKDANPSALQYQRNQGFQFAAWFLYLHKLAGCSTVQQKPEYVLLMDQLRQQSATGMRCHPSPESRQKNQPQ